MKLAFYLCLLAAMLHLPTAVANQKIEVQHYEAQTLVSSGQILSLDVTLKSIQAMCHGKLLDAHLYQHQGDLRYEVQIRTDKGQRVELLLDAKTGLLTQPVQLPISCSTENL
ncbi:PepSY domain-containing protein [Shewanella sp. 125m-7]